MMGRLLSDQLILQRGTTKNFDLHSNLGDDNQKFTWKDSKILVKLQATLVSDKRQQRLHPPKNRNNSVLQNQESLKIPIQSTTEAQVLFGQSDVFLNIVEARFNVKVLLKSEGLEITGEDF